MKGPTRSTAPSGGDWLWNSNALGATGAGNSQGTATAIPFGQDLTFFSTVAAGTGGILPTGISRGEEYAVANHGLNALAVYPPVGGQIGTAAMNAAYSLAAGKTGYFVCLGNNTFTANP